MQYKMTKVTDARGHEIRGIWERNGRYYARLRYADKKNATWVPLTDENNQPVQTAAQAVAARNRLQEDRRQGKTPGPRITPPFDKYVQHYLEWLTTTQAKSKLTIAREGSSLNHCVEHFGCTRLSAITAGNITAYILKRKQENVSSRNLNLQIVALRNLFEFAKTQEGILKHELPTVGLKQLPYKAAKRELITSEDIDAICAEATRRASDPETELILRIQKDYRRPDGTIDWHAAWTEHPEWKKQLRADTDEGRQAVYSRAAYLANNPEAAHPPVYEQGQMLADWIRLMAYSGARRMSAQAVQWKDVDWQNQQLHLTKTKFSKHIVVPFNPKLEAHLKEMQTRRVPTGEKGELSPYLFPSPRSPRLPRPPRQDSSTESHIANFQKTLDKVRTAAKRPNFNPHDLRHYFISMCVMDGTDYMTIAKWAGHADGGVLVGNTYGHLNPGHEKAAAAKLSFGSKPVPLAEPPATAGGGGVDWNKISVAEFFKQLGQAQNLPKNSA